MARRLSSFEHAIKALGGVTEVARLTGRRPANVCQWRSRHGAFPARLYLVISRELARRGCDAPVGLFHFERPGKRALGKTP